MKCLITGAEGFAGGHLTEYLLSKGEEVFCLTLKVPEKHQKLRELAHSVTIFECNLLDREKVASVVKNCSPEYVFHLAGQSNVVKSWETVYATFETNVLGTINLLDSVLHLGCGSRVLLVCSADIYGTETGERKALKETAPINPSNPYALSKVCVDFLGDQYASGKGMDIIRIRPFNHIGPGQERGFVTADFSWQIARIEKGLQEPIVRVGNLNSSKDFTDVRDMVRAYYLAMKSCKTGEAYNIGSGKMYNIRNILDILLSMSNIDIQVVSEGHKKRKTETIIGDSSKFMNLTDWKPEISIEETLHDVLDYWRERVEVGN